MNSIKTQNDSSFYDAVYYAVKRLLYKRYYDVSNEKLTERVITTGTAERALNDVIGYGGGFTFQRIGDYFLFDYAPGIKVSLSRSDGKSIIEEKVNRALVIKVAEECMKEFRGPIFNCHFFKITGNEQ